MNSSTRAQTHTTRLAHVRPGATAMPNGWACPLRTGSRERWPKFSAIANRAEWLLHADTIRETTLSYSIRVCACAGACVCAFPCARTRARAGVGASRRPSVGRSVGQHHAAAQGWGRPVTAVSGETRIASQQKKPQPNGIAP